MKINTKHFGEMEIDDNKVIFFEEGIPGFPDLRKFTLISEINNDNTESPFFWLQSLEEKEIAFILIDLFNVMPDYNPIVEREIVSSLGKCEKDDLIIYNIVVIPSDINKLSVNLKAPIVININTNKGKQIIANNEEYPIKFYLYEYLKNNNKKAGE